jgi:glycosyltransferase involved in cell wall biosynthesis
MNRNAKRLNIQFVSPVLNEELLLPRLIQSLLNQTDTNWNLLIVDNCSTDSTLKIAMQFEKSDLRIRAIQLDERKRTVYESWKAALDICFEVTDCEYVQIIPGDDYIFNNDYVELSLSKLSQHNINSIVPNFKYYNRNLVLDQVKYKSLFEDWNYVHLIFGIYKKLELKNAINKLNKIDNLTNEFDWWLSYFLIDCAPLYSPNTVFYREQNRHSDPQETVVMRPILDHPTFITLKESFPILPKILNYFRATRKNFYHYILVKGSFGTRNRIRLGIAFLLKLLQIYKNFSRKSERF